MADMSPRAAILARRTYSRLKDDGAYESWFETIDRAIRHQAWLWARARGPVEGSAGNAESVFHDPTPDAVVDAGRVLDDEATKARVLPQIAAVVLPGADELQAKFVNMMDSPRRVVLEVTPEKWITFDAGQMMVASREL